MAKLSLLDRWERIEFVDEFEVLPEHIALLRRVHTSWTGDEGYGAPGLRRKRPFGNSDMYDDIAEIVDGRTNGSHDEADETRYDQLYVELTLVMEIVLQSGQFESGRYIKPPVGAWKRA